MNKKSYTPPTYIDSRTSPEENVNLYLQQLNNEVDKFVKTFLDDQTYLQELTKKIADMKFEDYPNFFFSWTNGLTIYNGLISKTKLKNPMIHYLTSSDKFVNNLKFSKNCQQKIAIHIAQHISQMFHLKTSVHYRYYSDENKDYVFEYVVCIQNKSPSTCICL